jgi:hypothetical protein
MPSQKFCPECGEKIDSKKRCHACGQVLPAGGKNSLLGFEEAPEPEMEKSRLDAAAALLPGVPDVGPGELIFRASQDGPHGLSTHDIAKLETYVGNGLGLHAIASRDAELAVKVHRALAG